MTVNDDMVCVCDVLISQDDLYLIDGAHYQGAWGTFSNRKIRERIFNWESYRFDYSFKNPKLENHYLKMLERCERRARLARIYLTLRSRGRYDDDN